MRKKIVAGNWKMNLGLTDALILAEKVKERENDYPCGVILIPSFPFLTSVKKVLEGSRVQLGAQNCADKENGAFTGEVSVTQLKSVGAEYVIIGHSERRENYGESNEVLRQKLVLVLKHGLKPIFCCGEPLQVRNENNQEVYVLNQLHESLFGLTEAEMASVIVAYEPIWAIGTGLNATPGQAQEMHAFIRRQIATQYSDILAGQTIILYGGSCKPANAPALFACADVDGGLIGGASLQADDFLAIIGAAK
ncbi:MAG TPA: triose-phosphate isomerase [Chitinophagales bacterium]|nr:triose-phosphate isomerase [Chitinophagales bacterium]